MNITGIHGKYKEAMSQNEAYFYLYITLHFTFSNFTFYPKYTLYPNVNFMKV